MTIKKHPWLRLLAIGILMLTVKTAFAREIFEALVEEPQVESTYITGNLFAHNRVVIPFIPGVNFSDTTQKVSEIYIYDCYSTESVRKAKTILDAYLKKNPKLELVMRKNSSLQSSFLYMETDAHKKNKELILWNKDGENVGKLVVIEWQ